MNISIVIPAYNEEKRIEPTLKKIITYLNSNFVKYEIIIVDDCSKDMTYKIISKYKMDNIKILRNKMNMGKGYSVKKGILNARYNLVLFSDSDLATPIEELKNFIDYIKKGYDIVIASRNLEESNVKVKQHLYKQLMGKTFLLLVNIVTGLKFKDTQCGFKLFKKDIIQKIIKLQTIDRFSFDTEILFIAKKLGYKIKEAPVTWINQKGTKVKPIGDGIKMFIDMFRMKYNNLSGRYKIE